MGLVLLVASCASSPSSPDQERADQSQRQGESSDDKSADEGDADQGESYVETSRRACIDGDYSSCCHIVIDEKERFDPIDHDFAELYLRSPCLSEDRSFEACTFLGVALHEENEGRTGRAQDFFRVACYGGEVEACQWLDHLGVELRGVPVDADDDRLGEEDFARGCGFR